MIESAREVHAQGAIDGQPVLGPIGREDAAGKAIDLLERADRSALLWREEAIALVDGIGATEEAAREHAEGVVVVLRQAQLGRRVARPRQRIKLGADKLMDIEQKAGLAVLVDGIHALLVIEVAGQIVGHLIGAAGRRQAVLTAMPRAEGTVGLQGIKAQQSRLHARRCRTHRRDQCAQGIERVETAVIGRIGRDLVQDTALGVRVPPRRAGLPLFGL